MFSPSTSTSPAGRLFRLPQAAFSLVELIMMIASIGILVTVAISYMSSSQGKVPAAKLESDVATLNQMVALYIADGGDLGGLTSPQEVLDRMKRVRPQAEWKQHPGMASGRLIDVRMRARVSSSRSSKEEVRAVWNRATSRFEISTASTGSAVSEFYLDPALISADFGTETRKASVKKYNNSNGWVWTSQTRDPTASSLTPTTVNESGTTTGFNPGESSPTGGPGGGGSGGGGGGSGGGGGGGGGTTPPANLPAPTITPSGGTFAFSAFPSSVSISANGAPPADSTLMISVNGGAWTPFAGGTYSPLVPPATIKAKNETTNPTAYNTSPTNTQTYYRLTSGFSGSGLGSWGNATGGTNLVTNVQNGPTTSTFKHGNTKLDLGNGQYLDAGVENVLSFTREEFSTITPNSWFKFGDLVMLNGTTFYDSEASGVTLTMNITLTQPAVTITTHINLGLISTENTSDRLASADIVELKNPVTDAKVTIDGVEYTLELSWATLDPGAGVVQGNQFLIFEGSSAHAELRARFKSNR